MSETRAQKIGSPDVGLRSHDRETVSPDSARDELNLAPACRCVPFVKAWGAPPLPLPCREVALPPSPQCSQFLPASGPLCLGQGSRGRAERGRRISTGAWFDPVKLLPPLFIRPSPRVSVSSLALRACGAPPGDPSQNIDSHPPILTTFPTSNAPLIRT